MDNFDSEDDNDLLAAVCELDAESKDDDDLLATMSELDAKLAQTEETLPEITQAVPDLFPFPFTPYTIQTDFMQNLYTCIEQSKIGIFESPTGTGKSLSLICGSLKWLRDYQARQRSQLNQLNTSGQNKKPEKELDWISEFAAKKAQEEKLAKIKMEQQQIDKREARLKELQVSHIQNRKRKRTSKQDLYFDDLMSGAPEEIRQACKEELEAMDKDDGNARFVEDDELLVADYNSDEESSGKKQENEGCEDTEDQHVTKIYYCSRTHSQLSQFIREIIKSPFQDVRVISLGSRQTMCINSAVRKLPSITLINDRCLELQNKKSKKKPGCPYHSQGLMDTLKDKALLEVVDMEQLVGTGREMKACPYYAARFAVSSAEVVALPYNTILHKSTREACGIKLSGSVVIIDEAHNLLETINNIHSVEITAAQVVKAHCQLRQYENKFRARLKAKNLLYVRQLLFVLSHLAEVLGGNVNSVVDSQSNSKEEVTLLTINDFLFKSKLDNFNMFKLLFYCHKSQISKKLHGFVEKYPEAEVKQESKKPVSGVTRFLEDIQTSQRKQGKLVTDEPVPTDQSKPGFMSSPLMQIEMFLGALTTANPDGRVVVNKQGLLSLSSLKFLMLNPAVHFVSILQEARSVVVAGGTMQPVSEFKDQLLHAAGVSPDRVLEFSCGHIICGSQLLPLAVARGPTGQLLDFTYQNRDKPHMLAELGRLLCQVCQVVPGGVVCFFPSYDYETLVHSAWEKTGILQKIRAKKQIFREPKRSGLAEQVLAEFTSCIKRCATWQGNITGAVLMSVVGGKMSEGINFSDELGRCVVMVGLPYPNIHSPELQEKMSYLSKNFSPGPDGKAAGQVHYENLCMKAVNQSIGRAIRHKDDYASILLLDQRYLKPSVNSKLPQWISEHLQCLDQFSLVMQHLPKFFSEQSKTS